MSDIPKKELPKMLVIWNPNSGRAESAAELKKLLEQHPSVTLREPTSREESVSMAAEAGQQGFEVVVAAGGDGTVNAVANGILASQSDVAMAVLPVGTANDFSFTLGMPDDLAQACEELMELEMRVIDLVELETANHTQYYVNVAAGGNSDRVTESLTDELKQKWGAWCYIRGAIAVMTDLTSFHAVVSFDDQAEVEIDLWNVIVANGRTNAGRLLLAPFASPEDGLLDVVLIRDGTVLDLASLASQFLLQDYLRSDQVVFRQAHSFSIRTEPEMHFSVDGEVVSEQPLRFRALPRVLKVVVGKSYLPVSAQLEDATKS